MNTTKTKIVVVSPPRTGTMSISQMMKTLGFSVHHAPGPTWYQFFEKVDFLADTPVFTKASIEHVMNSEHDTKFIYLEKPVDEWIASMRKVGLDNSYNTMCDQLKKGMELNAHNMCDYDSLFELLQGSDGFYDDTAKAGFLCHKEWVMENIPSDSLLVYNFADGWEPLCNFVGKPIPADVDVPHLNVTTMFDKLV